MNDEGVCRTAPALPGLLITLKTRTSLKTFIAITVAALLKQAQIQTSEQITAQPFGIGPSSSLARKHPHCRNVHFYLS